MSVDFVKNKIGSNSLIDAVRQQKQLSYLTQSSIQQDITFEYLTEWAQRKYKSNDDFLNWVKTVFKTANFLSFYKYLRFPIPSAKLVNDIIKPQLGRVFFSEDAFFRYTIKGDLVENPEELKCGHFEKMMFDALLFRHNDIVVVDFEDVNEPYRQIIPIEDVVAIESEQSEIKKIAYTAEIEIESGLKIKGFAYIDEEQYIFYNHEFQIVKQSFHDLGECPADYVSNEAFSDNDSTRKSIFSFVREELEEYVFLKTLQRMTEPNMVIPVTTQLKTKKSTDQQKDFKGSTEQEPMSSREMGGQKSDQFGSEITGSDSLVQAGTIIEVPIVKRDDGTIDMDVVKNFINFIHAPVEPFNFLSKRVQEIKDSILKTVLGDMADQTNDRKNELQVQGGFVSAEDRLRSFAMQMSRLRKRTDFNMLALRYGKDNVSNDAFYGSDFYLETQKDLYELFELSPNPIERKNILLRLSKNRNRFNKDRSEREVLMYELMPYAADADFEKAIENLLVDKLTFQLQTRFAYWIGIFEAEYGDIVYFWNSTEGTKSEKLMLISNLLMDIVEQRTKGKEMIVQPNAGVPATN